METGCLLIDELLFETRGLAPFDEAATRGLRAERFIPNDPRNLHIALQRAYQRVRRDDAPSGILAYGTGCDCALALASQLPTDRLALLSPLDWQGGGPQSRQLRRIRSYARRGAAFCVSRVLIVPGLFTAPDLPDRLRRALCNSRVIVLEGRQAQEEKSKEVLKTAILHFLRHGVLPKSLAENPEMCIIYG